MIPILYKTVSAANLIGQVRVYKIGEKYFIDYADSSIGLTFAVRNSFEEAKKVFDKVSYNIDLKGFK